MTRAAPKTDLGGFRPREKVYTRGDSDSGQLGLGGYAPRHTFTQVGALRALQVTHVAAGLAAFFTGFMGALCALPAVYCCYYYSSYQFGS